MKTLSALCDGDWSARSWRRSGQNWFDFLVIGSGTAGCGAGRPAERGSGSKVGLVEAGGPARPIRASPIRAPGRCCRAARVDWAYRTIPQRHAANRVLDWPRGKVIGGSTALNAMAHVRGHPDDFDRWVARRLHRLGLRRSLPYFLQSKPTRRAPRHFTATAARCISSARATRIPLRRPIWRRARRSAFAPTDDHNGPRMTGPCLNTLTIKDGKRQTIADAYLAPAAGRPNLTAALQRRGFVADARKAGAAAASRHAKTALEFQRRTTSSLATGAIGSPCLLTALRHRPGRRADAASASRSPPIARGRPQPARPPALRRQCLSCAPARAALELPELGIADVYRARRRERRAGIGAGLRDSAGRYRAIHRAALWRGLYHHVRLHPSEAAAAIRLASADPKGTPLIDPNYLAEDYDRDAYLDALEAARPVGAGSGTGRLAGRGSAAGTRVQDKAAKTRLPGEGRLHPPSSGRRPAAWAVMPQAWSIRISECTGSMGSHVCDASVIPAITTGPVNAAIVAIAERASDLLRGRPVMPPGRLA